jgi:uncharacterized repeat protein (TIGR01451 family)
MNKMLPSKLIGRMTALMFFIAMAAASASAAPVSGGFELLEYVPVPTETERAVNFVSGTAPRVVAGGASGPLEAEPNNAFGVANPIAGSSAQITGNIFPAADVDFYSFTAAAGDRVYAATQTLFDASASGDSTLQVLASDGTTIIEADNNDGTFNGNSASIAGTVIPTAGTYYVRVAHNVATGMIRPYHLSFRLQSTAPAAEVEPNNDTLTPTPIPASGHVTGAISAVSPGESDFYSITLAAGDSVYLSLDMNPERDAAVWNGRLGFGLFGNPPANQILLANDANTGATATDPNSEAFFFTVKDAGTYFVYVDSIVAAGLGATATYNLSATVYPRVLPPGTCTTYSSADTPVVIPTGPGSVTSTITVPGNPRIADLDVAINLNHTFMQDVDAHLISPAGNDNGLFTDIGAATAGGPQTLMDIVLDDEAALPFAFALSSTWRNQPELAYRLGWFDGENAGGNWTLQLRDDATGDGGTLNSWSITVCEPPPPPTCPPGFGAQVAFSTDFESGDAGFTHSGVTDEWERGLPSFAPITTCNSGVNCWKTDLDNTYNAGVAAGTPQDLLSPAISLAGLTPPIVVSWAQRYQIESASFDRAFIDFQQVGGATPLRLWEWRDATMTSAVGNPAVTVAESSGWSQYSLRADSLAGLNTELRFNLTSDNTVQLTGLAIDDVTVTGCRALSADLSITKTDGVTNAVPGGSVTYTITASNAGPDPITGATVADTFPAVLTCTWTCAGAGGGACTAAMSGNINDAVDLPVGGSATYTASCAVAASATGSLSNTATVTSAITDPTPGNNSATDTDTLTPQADLAITKTDSVTSANPGGSVTYTITASNAGPSDAPGSSIADTFPASLTCTWTCVGAGGGTCTAAGSGNINDTANLPAGGSTTYTASCTISAAATGTLANTATVTAGGSITDPVPGNNSATDTDTLDAVADLSITKTDGVASVAPGGALTYTISASNAGPSNATGATVADTFPAALTCTWTCVGAGGGTCAAAGSGNINDTVNLPSGGSVTYTASCTVSGAASGTIDNTATVAAPGGVTDPTPGNNSATDSDMVVLSSDLSITKTDGVSSVGPGGTLTYTIVASNTGPQAANGATVADTFPAECATVTWTCAGTGGATCTAAGSGAINDTVNLPAAGTATYTATCAVSGAVANGTVISNTATVTIAGGGSDPVPGNNTATDATTVAALPNVSGTKTVAGAFSPGGAITYTITLSNSGAGAQGDNPGDEFVDVLPASLTLVSASSSSGTAVVTIGTNTVNWNGSIAAAGSVTITINATINPTAIGTVTNQGTINFDADGNGTNETTRPTDDPALAGGADPTGFAVAGISIPVPTLSTMALIALSLMVLGLGVRRRLV